ncbi:hypothetical protein [Sphingomonas abaci]|uniref:Uncharacterized protein n=1 Tax=Sphingomonas abaci TaxID=237611 RepID=A0A7W7EZR9_9SPHN|nr:hypothetical protein [Sphingomonas abaci]MBB4620118.1 hypothetical protein [Sphingomonas abaci]
MSEDRTTPYWAEDPYWVEALERFVQAREAGTQIITIDLNAIEESLFNGDGPAYRLMEAMASVQEHEGYDGYRGAPRLVLALLQHLKESRPNR